MFMDYLDIYLDLNIQTKIHYQLKFKPQIPSILHKVKFVTLCFCLVFQLIKP